MSSEEAFKFPRTASYSTRMAGQFLQLKREGELADFSVQCGETTFQCHKVILAACSPVLKAMMMSGMNETSKHLMQLDDIPAAVMQQLLDYMYTGDANVPKELLLSIIKACDYLELLELKEDCQSKSVSVCTPDNVISCYKLADTLNIEELKAKCSEILASSFAEVAKASEFFELSIADVSGYISDAQETKVDPDDLLEATMGWVAHDPTIRGDHVLGILKQIDLSGCSLECLDTEMDTHAIVLESHPAVSRPLTKGMSQVAKKDPIRRARREEAQSQPRGMTKLAVIAVHRKMSLYLDPSMQFKELCAIEGSTVWYSACETPEGFVLTGGHGSVLCTLFVSATKSWKPLKRLSVSRYQHGAIFTLGKLVLLGGFISGSESTSVQSLELHGSWKDEPDLLEAVRLPEVACVDDEVFLLDAFSTGQLFHFDVERQVWSRKATLPTDDGNCRGARMTAVRGELLVAGGNSATCARYSPDTDTWQTVNPPLLTHHFGALIHHDLKLYLIGGQNENRVEEYNFDTKAWSVSAFKLPWGEQNLHAVALDV